MSKTLALSDKERDTDADFDDFEIELYSIIFDMTASRDGIGELYKNLNYNDKNDYDIICDVIYDSNNISYFITSDTTRFISNGKKQKIEELSRSYGKFLTVTGISRDMLSEVKKHSKEYKF